MNNFLKEQDTQFKIKVLETDYWDHYLYNPKQYYKGDDGILDEECLSAYIDTNDENCVDGDELLSKDEYVWEHSINNGVTLNNIGLTGVDNGLILYDKNEIDNEEYLDLFNNSKMVLPPDDLRLHLNKVGGNNKIYSYDAKIVKEDGIKVAKLQGGFYQGFFKLNDGCDYNILPTHVDNGWTLEFTLKPKIYKSDYSIFKQKYSDNDYNSDGWDSNDINEKYNDNYFGEDYVNDDVLPTLNDIYPDNNGIFFYIGTRSENKWWNYYKNNLTTNLTTSNNVFLNEQVDLINTNNKFITYHKAKNGYTVSHDGNVETDDTLIMEKQLLTDNYFILMHKAKGGYTTRTIKELKQKSNAKYNIIADLYRNALAFQLKQDGSIGYKYLVKNCEKDDNYEVVSEWSLPNMVNIDEWVTISIRIIPYGNVYADYYNELLDTMRILLYVNGKLVLYSKELPMLSLRRLNDIYEKQESVPFNISIGGGTQGLADVVYEDCQKIPEYVLYLEKEFGGSFNGYLKSFKFYTCDKNYNNINNNVLFEQNNLKNNYL